jgi:hypothetical protein
MAGLQAIRQQAYDHRLIARLCVEQGKLGTVAFTDQCRPIGSKLLQDSFFRSAEKLLVFDGWRMRQKKHYQSILRGFWG